MSDTREAIKRLSPMWTQTRSKNGARYSAYALVLGIRVMDNATGVGAVFSPTEILQAKDPIGLVKLVLEDKND